MWSGTSAVTSLATSSLAVLPGARRGTGGHAFLIAFSRKRRGMCVSCNARRMAASDLRYLFDGLAEHRRAVRSSGLDACSERSLKRVWNAERSW
jgi:hypothetical protein